VLTDDVAAIDISDNNDMVKVLVGHPLVKLRGDSASWLFGRDQPARSSLDGRVHLTKDPIMEESFSLDKLYLMENKFSSEVGLSPVSSRQTVMELTSHTHGAHLLTRKDYQMRLLDQCSAVADSTPICRIHRRKGLDHLPKLLDVVEEDLSALERSDGGSVKSLA